MSTTQNAATKQERTSGPQAAPAGGDPPQSAKTPVGPGAITFLGVLLALGVIALGALGLQAAASAAGITHAQPWLTRAIEATDGLRPLGWMLPVGIILLLLGLWLLLTALRPRPKTAVALQARTGVFLRPRDLGRLAVDTAADIDGVSDVRAKVGKGTVTLQVESTGGPGVSDAVREAVTERLAPLQKKLKVRVKTKQAQP